MSNMTFYITNKASGLMLDATAIQVRLEELGNSPKPSQLWKIHRGENHVVLENFANGNVLDFDENGNVITTKRSVTKLNQQWSPTSDDFIKCKHINHVLHCEGGYLTSGTRLIVYPENSPTSPNQLFSIDPAF